MSAGSRLGARFGFGDHLFSQRVSLTRTLTWYFGARIAMRSSRSESSRRRVPAPAASGVTCVPPIQRSTPSSSTRSASPREHPLAGSRSAGAASRAKSWPSLSGGGGGQRLAVVGLDEPRRLPAPSAGERAVEPGVAEERRLLESLRRDERGGRRARAGGDRLERPPLRPREPVRRRRQLLEQPPQRGREKRQLARSSRVAHSASAVGSGARKAAQALAAASSAAGAASRRAGQSVSSSLARQLAEPGGTTACRETSRRRSAPASRPARAASASTSRSWSWS